jgi:hypothetical protein
MGIRCVELICSVRIGSTFVPLRCSRLRSRSHEPRPTPARVGMMALYMMIRGWE